MDLLLVFYRLVVAGWLLLRADMLQPQAAPVGSRRLMVAPQPHCTSLADVFFGGQITSFSHGPPVFGVLVRAERNIQHPRFALWAGDLEGGRGRKAR